MNCVVPRTMLSKLSQRSTGTFKHSQPKTIMVQENVLTMGPIHSTSSRGEQRSPRELRLVRQEVEKLFAMDCHASERTLYGVKGHHNSNRWNVLRFLESASEEPALGDGKSDVTATSSCSSSPNFPTFPQLGPKRCHIEDSSENLAGPKTQSTPRSRYGVNGLRKSQHRDSRSGFTPDDAVDNGASSVSSSRGRSRPIPVTKLQVNSMNTTNGDENDIDDTAEENHLKQIYDLRTWEMYVRISEARKKAAKSKALIDNRSKCIPVATTAAAPLHHGFASHHLPQPVPVVQGGWPHFHNVHMIPYFPVEGAIAAVDPPLPSSQVSEHEMIFGDLDD